MHFKSDACAHASASARHELPGRQRGAQPSAKAPPASLLRAAQARLLPSRPSLPVQVHGVLACEHAGCKQRAATVECGPSKQKACHHRESLRTLPVVGHHSCQCSKPFKDFPLCLQLRASAGSPACNLLTSIEVVVDYQVDHLSFFHRDGVEPGRQEA